MKLDSWKRNKAYKALIYIFISAIIASAYYISSNWYQVSLIRGDSMSPAYHNMQFVLIDVYINEEDILGKIIPYNARE